MIIRRVKNRFYRLFWQLRGVQLLENSFIHRGCDIQNPQNVSIGSNCIIYKNTSIYVGKEGQFSLGNDSHIAPYGYLLIDKNQVTIGQKVAIGPFCSFFAHSNGIEPGADFNTTYVDLPITIGNNVFIGAQCIILGGTVIEDHVVVSANSVVKGQLESHSLYGGSPAKKIKAI